MKFFGIILAISFCLAAPAFTQEEMPAQEFADRAEKNGPKLGPAVETVDPSARDLIRYKCKASWPSDFEMQEYCEQKQLDALELWEIVQASKSDVIAKIAEKCNRDWPDDFEMKFYCYEKQMEARDRLLKR